MHGHQDSEVHKGDFPSPIRLFSESSFFRIKKVELFAEIAILDEVPQTLISPCEVRPHHKVEVLTVKLNMLLALASAGRSSDLRALYVRCMSVKDNSNAFELAQLTESRRKRTESHQTEFRQV